MHHSNVEEKRRDRCGRCMGIYQNGMYPGLLSQEMNFTTTSKTVPTNANFPDLCNLLAIEGGKLLVSVLRDMVADKVFRCTFPEFYACS